MDNSYYTGATLIRGSPHAHHHPHHHQPHHHPHHPHHHPAHHPHHHHGHFPAGSPAPTTALAGPPLLMQPRSNKNHLFSGAPLIRNGPQNGAGSVSSSTGPPPAAQQPQQSQPPPPPPGVICCFQPVYYVPMQHNPTTMHHPPPPQAPAQLALPAPPSSSSTPTTGAGPLKKQNPSQAGQPKRRNYKTLQINNNNNNGKLGHTPTTSAISSPTSPTMRNSIYSQSPLTPTKTGPFGFSRSSYSDTSDRNSSSSSPVESIYCSDTKSTDDNELNFQSVIQSSRFLISSEEKQRSDKLLNFYFYDEHWRPRETHNETGMMASTTNTTTVKNQPQFHHSGPYPSHNTTSAATANTNSVENMNKSSNLNTYDNYQNKSSSHAENDWLNNNHHINSDYCHENEIEAECKKNFLTYYSSSNGGGGGDPLAAPITTTTTAFRISQSQGNPSDVDNERVMMMSGSVMTPGSMACNNNNNSNASTAPPTNNPAAATMVIKKKDLEVEAQIVTLANGHRDLEIRLCYVTS